MGSSRVDRCQSSVYNGYIGPRASQAERDVVYWSLLIAFVLLIFLTQWITKHVQGVGLLVTRDGQVALILYFLLIFPGVVIHEISHALTARLLRVHVRHLSIGIRRKPNRQQIALGSVDIATTDPLRASLIGLAPLVAGCVAILLISDQVLGLETFESFSVPAFWREVRAARNVPDVGVWIYFVFAIGNAMLPSGSDRQSWGLALVFVLFLGALAHFSGLLEAVSEPLGRWLWAGANRLTYAFSITIVIDLCAAGFWPPQVRLAHSRRVI